MAGVYKKPSDKARGKAGKWTAWWVDETGKRKKRVAFTDKSKSLELAHRLENEAKLIREGLVDPQERVRREANLKPLDDHVTDYEATLVAKGGTTKHAAATVSTIRRLLESASITSVGDIAPDRIQEALGRMKAGKPPKSARTCNHALRAVQAFAGWLVDANRIKEVPRGLGRIPLYSEESDRRRVRRALTQEEMARLLAATESGPDEYLYGPTRSKHQRIPMTGLDRAMLYRVAMGTGFRADELRSLTSESFHLGDQPTVTCAAAYTKNGKLAVQPITRALADVLAPYLKGKPQGLPALIVPVQTAEILKRDLGRAGIPYKDSAGRVVDFHALRHSYITHLVMSGMNPKIVQKLARHSTITLTLDRYTHVEDEDIRKAIEKLASTPAPQEGANGAP